MTGVIPLAEPLARFETWWTARKAEDATESAAAMVVSSVDAHGRPSSRVVLLRGFDARGFVFYTNLQSRKGTELLAHPYAALNFHWPPKTGPGRQVRVEGSVERVSDHEADAYFSGRPRESQLGAWASDQSQPLASAAALKERLGQIRERFPAAVPRPLHWSGLRVVPDAIELWEEGEFRLHTRERYTRSASGHWSRQLLFP